MYELAVLATYIPAVLLLSTLSLGLFSELFSGSGSKGIVAAEVITLALGALVSVPVTMFLLKDATILEFGLIGFFAALVTIYFVSGSRNRDAEQAPALVEFAKKNFDRIDVKATGLIARSDVYKAIESGAFSADEVVMLKRLSRRVEAIGHAYDWMPIYSEPMPSFPVALYAIGRADLTTYVERTNRYRGGILA